MYKYTENLDGWETEPETNSCYLDSRYFYKCLLRYPGTIANPLNITIGKRRHNIFMKDTKINPDFPNLLRLSIKTPDSRHSNLLILDYQDAKVYRFEPLGKSAPYYDKINDMIEDYLSMFFDFDLEIIDIHEGIYDEKSPRCRKSGFCVAYIILYCYAFLNGQPYDSRHIRRFAKKIEKTYGSLPKDFSEPEYGFGNPNPNQGRNALIGGLGSLALGGVVAGGPGAVVGGLGGAVIGSVI